MTQMRLTITDNEKTPPSRLWFRGVAASVRLCLDLGAVFEGHPDVFLAVDRDVIHHRQPVGIPELRERLPAS